MKKEFGVGGNGSPRKNTERLQKSHSIPQGRGTHRTFHVCLCGKLGVSWRICNGSVSSKELNFEELFNNRLDNETAN